MQRQHCATQHRQQLAIKLGIVSTIKRRSLVHIWSPTMMITGGKLKKK
jgi:hypothetical protein